MSALDVSIAAAAECEDRHLPDVFGVLDGSEYAVATKVVLDDGEYTCWASSIENDDGPAVYLGRYRTENEAKTIAALWLHETGNAMVHEACAENGEPCPNGPATCKECVKDALAAGIPMAVIVGTMKIESSDYVQDMTDAGRARLLRPEDFNK